MSDEQRLKPISKYRIVQPLDKPTTAKIDYTDDRETAVQHAAKTGGFAEAFVYGIGWEPIGKVKP